jgi:Amt family ammonium transporter
MWGALATGLFVSIGSDLTRMAQFAIQVQGVIVAIIYAVVGTLIIGFITNLISGGLRVTEREETLGLDLSQHGERGFQLY